MTIGCQKGPIDILSAVLLLEKRKLNKVLLSHFVIDKYIDFVPETGKSNPSSLPKRATPDGWFSDIESDYWGYYRLEDQIFFFRNDVSYNLMEKRYDFMITHRNWKGYFTMYLDGKVLQRAEYDLEPPDMDFLGFGGQTTEELDLFLHVKKMNNTIHGGPKPYYWINRYLNDPAEATDQQIKAFEDEIGVKLPEDFVDFARHHQGKVPYPNDVKMSVLGPLMHFDKADRDTSLYFYSTAETVMFSRDPGGNFFGFDYTADPKNPPIIFYDHETDKSHKIYDNFTELLADIHDLDERTNLQAAD